MRRLAALIGLVLILLAGPATAAGAWSTFKDPGGVYQIDMPQPPRVAHSAIALPTGGEIPSEQAMVVAGGYSLLVLVNDYSALHLDFDTVMKRGVASAQARGRKLVSNAAATVGRHPGRDLVLTSDKDETIGLRMFFFNDHLYQVLSILPPGAKAADIVDVKRFATSLRFLK